MRPAAWVCLALAWVAAAPAWAQESEEAPQTGFSGLPIAGYDDKDGWVFGGAAFIYSDHEPGLNAGLFALSNFNAFHSATFNAAQRGLGPWSYDLHLLGERAFDRYYGEGDLTSPTAPIFIRQDRLDLKPVLYYRPWRRWRVGAFQDLRWRQEPDSRWFPDETTETLGLRAQFDGRDKLINTRRGGFYQLDVARSLGQVAFTQWELDLRRFWRLRRNLVLGERVVADLSYGPVTYLFRYRLGGLDFLRGYEDNRFRGSDRLVTQSELRWSWNRWLALNASVDGGAIRDDAFHQWKASFQLGLRVGLPPDGGQKLRLDAGLGADQHTFTVQFGEIF